MARLAAEIRIPVLVVPGTVAPGWEAILPYVSGVEPVVSGTATEQQARERPAEMLSLAAERALRGWRTMRAAGKDAS